MQDAEQTKQKILVAEDNDFVRMQISKFLQDGGYEVDEFETAADAVSSISNSYGAAIIDVRMEPMGGFEFIKSMRSQKIETPAILVTGDQDPDLLNEASKLGVLAVLIKPVQKDRLIKTVEKAIQKSKRKSG